jgi:hypothetical protein
MSKRLQVLVSETVDRRIRKAAQRRRVSAGAWVRDAIEAALREDGTTSPLERLAALDGPTSDLDQMLGEIEQGRG